MGPVQSIKTCLRKFAAFSGRASRSEFWWFAPFWQFGAVALYAGLVSTPNTKYQIYGSIFLFCVLSLPALSAAALRAIDAGFDVSWVGWSYGAIIFGGGLIYIQSSPANVSEDTWFTPGGLSIMAIGAVVLVFVLSRPSRISTNPHEVSP